MLTAVYNAERYLPAAIESILTQTHRDFEFVIVDDGSTDRSRAIVRSYIDPRITLVALDKNVGLSAALNEGLKRVTTQLVARQDADDVSEPHRLERQLAVMQGSPALALLGSRASAMTEDGKDAGVVWRPVDPVSIRWYGLFDNPFAHTSVVFKTEVVRDELGGFDPAFDPFNQDYALWCRLMERHPFANLPDRLVRYRVNAASITGAMETGDPNYRSRFESLVRELVTRHARHTLSGAISDEEIDLLPGFVLGVDERHVRRFLDLFERLLAEFVNRHPGARELPDFRETLARQFDALALRVRPATRRSSSLIYMHALRRHPVLATYFSWPRVAALLLLGKGGRGRIAEWRANAAR